MTIDLLALVEREILAWPGVTKEHAAGGPAPGGFWVPPATVYHVGRRQLGHIHYDGQEGVADLLFPKKVHDALIAAGRAVPHGAGFAGVVSYHLRVPSDVPPLVELFRLGYDRARSAAAPRDPSEANLADGTSVL
jgi:hypothetical protein